MNKPDQDWMDAREIAILIARAIKAAKKDAEAAIEYVKRRDGREHPPGNFDRAGRFYAAERRPNVLSYRSPSARYPYPEMRAARTAEHVALLNHANVKNVRVLAKAVTAALDKLQEVTKAPLSNVGVPRLPRHGQSRQGPRGGSPPIGPRRF